ncbi:MAG: hypothetical protein KAY32_07060 [Candidatus Eisenbacteria sp.]|nr:hypothetical protein [Candidatus Eisenbacteria bacterium]
MHCAVPASALPLCLFLCFFLCLFLCSSLVPCFSSAEDVTPDDHEDMGMPAATDAVNELGIAWQSSETVDAPVAEVSSPSGPSVLYAEDAWHVVYCRDGQVRCRARDASGWLAVETVSTVPGTASDPHIAWQEDEFFVVWEDDRTGIPEVWVRTRTAAGWSAETCLTGDETPSRAPVIAARASRMLVAWQEGEGGTEIRSCYHVGGWSTPVTVSSGAGSASEPTVCGWEGDGWFFGVVWSDTRHGAAEIYLRSGNGDSWGTEQRLTDLPGECRHPSITSEKCGLETNHAIIVFEHTAPGGVAEIWTVCGEPWVWLVVERVSADDGTRSVSPTVGAFSFFVEECNFPYSEPHPILVWTDLGSADKHRLSHGPFCPAAEHPVEPISEGGPSRVAVGAVEGRPDAHLIVLWVEKAAGVRTLQSRRGSLTGCSIFTMADPPPLWLSPGGTLIDTLVTMEECSGAMVPGLAFELEFSPALDQALTWDPLQEHPAISGQTDAQGRAYLALRGGGCSQAGEAYAHCWGVDFLAEWEGARSPDLNGDCIVGLNDLAAVEAALGTDDFCADLDGSGWVDAADVAIVQGRLGDRCSHVAGIDPAIGGLSALLAIEPNPCRDHATFTLRGSSGSTRIEIFDINGRLVHVLQANGDAIRQQEKPPSGFLDGAVGRVADGSVGGAALADGATGGSAEGVTRIDWDLRDAQGRALPSGIYLIRAAGLRHEAHRSILVLR